MSKLFFKLEYTVRDLRIPPEDVLSFDFGGAHEVKVLLQAPSHEEHRAQRTDRTACAPATKAARALSPPTSASPRCAHSPLANAHLRSSRTCAIPPTLRTSPTARAPRAIALACRSTSSSRQHHLLHEPSGQRPTITMPRPTRAKSDDAKDPLP